MESNLGKQCSEAMLGSNLGKQRLEAKLGSSDGKQFGPAVCRAVLCLQLSPSVSALKEMVKICSEFASSFDIQFNSAQSQLIGFKCNSKNVFDPGIKLNGQNISHSYFQ